MMGANKVILVTLHRTLKFLLFPWELYGNSSLDIICVSVSERARTFKPVYMAHVCIKPTLCARPPHMVRCILILP